MRYLHAAADVDRAISAGIDKIIRAKQAGTAAGAGDGAPEGTEEAPEPARRDIGR